MTLYAIIIKDTQELLNPKTFKSYWKNYGNNSLYGWRVPKKVYDSIGRAKAGFSHVPEEMKDKLAIAEFKISDILIEGTELKKIQDEKKERQEKEREQRNLRYKLERAEKELKQAEENLRNLLDKS
jgi:hypothetical protein